MSTYQVISITILILLVIFILLKYIRRKRANLELIEELGGLGRSEEGLPDVVDKNEAEAKSSVV